jgi:formylglycine-generating enzyme required for sulfatase activity
VSWYEAEAYCNWLATQNLSIPIPKGYSVRLPTEEEWERAARGTDGREYPWGEEFDKTKAHTVEVHPEDEYGFGTMAVCTFPQGISPVGAWDMSGNVFEWTLTEESRARVLRGGSWIYNDWYARCAFRFFNSPVNRYNFFGFRVVVSLAFR